MDGRVHDIDTFYQQTQFILETTRSIIWAIDTVDENILWMEGPIESLFNVGFGQLMERQLFFENGIHPDDRSKVKRRFQDIAQGKTDQFHVEFRTNPNNGPIQWIEAHGRFHSEEDNKLLGISTEITDRKQQEQRLERQNERLEEFARIVSHDLRNPLNIAEGHLELASSECDSEHIDHVKQSHDRMRALIDDLLTLARRNDSLTDRDSIALSRFVEDCWTNVETETASLITDTDLTIQADKRYLNQLFENLISNSIEHNSGDVTITVGELEDGFYVEDDGSGIPKADRQSVFQAGYSTEEQGTGFGLSITKKIVEEHDWDIRLTESPKGGARFEITGVEFAE